MLPTLIDEGTLYLMPVWLGEHGGIEQLPPENIAICAVERITLYFCEHEKTARHMLRRMVPGSTCPPWRCIAGQGQHAAGCR